MESTLISSYAIALTMDSLIDFAFSPHLRNVLLVEKLKALHSLKFYTTLSLNAISG